MQRKSTKKEQRLPSKSTKKRELHKPDKFEKEDQNHNKKNDEEDKENNYQKNDTTKKRREDDVQDKKKQKNINLNNDDMRNKKRSWFNTFVESIDSEVDLRCKKMATEATVLASRLTKAERVWTMQLPKCVREMNVKEFVEKYNANVNLVMQASFGPHEKPSIIYAPNDRPIAIQREIEDEKSVDTTEKQMEKLEKKATQSHQIPLAAATPPPTTSSKEAIPQVEVQSFLQQYFSNPNLTVEERKNQANFIVKQMHCLERILVRQGKYENKN